MGGCEECSPTQAPISVLEVASRTNEIFMSNNKYDDLCVPMRDLNV
jgi:hypothetical protein